MTILLLVYYIYRSSIITIIYNSLIISVCMDNGVEQFKSRISNESFWKYFEVKACLLRGSKDKTWKVGFLNIQLMYLRVRTKD
jgi:hypothetical protein